MTTPQENQATDPTSTSWWDNTKKFFQRLGDFTNIPESYKRGLTQDLAQSEYDFRYLAFPNDLGMDHVGHYMVININVPTEVGGNRERIASRFQGEQFFTTPTNEVQRSKVDTLRYAGGVTRGGLNSGGLGVAAGSAVGAGLGVLQGQGLFSRIVGGVIGAAVGGAVVDGLNQVQVPLANSIDGTPQAQFFSLPRYTRRIKESIALHMPTQLIHTHQNEYQDISLTEVAGKVVTAPFGAIGEFVSNIAEGAAKLGGRPINPGVEVLFTTTFLRTFVFDVLMAPRNENESETLLQIIRALKFHSSPELNYGSVFGDAGAGLTWIPPAEFDITFFKHGEENLNIPRINTCVMERLEIDYAPTGVYSTFRNGHPVMIRLGMAFRELEPISKLRVTQGF